MKNIGLIYTKYGLCLHFPKAEAKQYFLNEHHVTEVEPQQNISIHPEELRFMIKEKREILR